MKAGLAGISSLLVIADSGDEVSGMLSSVPLEALTRLSGRTVQPKARAVRKSKMRMQMERQKRKERKKRTERKERKRKKTEVEDTAADA